MGQCEYFSGSICVSGRTYVYLYVHIFVSVDDSGGFVYCVTASCGPSLHECMSVYVHVCDCTYVCISCVYMALGSGVHRLAGRAPLPTEAWPGVGLGGTGLNPSATDSRIYRAPSRT